MEIETTNPAVTLDAYELRHLVTHLELAHREDDLHRLLSLETDDKKNAWYEAKEAFGDSQGYLVDVNHAWRIAECAYSLDHKLETGSNIGRQFYYALIRASLNSLASNVPPGLLSVAVQEGLSTPSQAFASIKGLPDEALLAASLAELAPHLSDTSLLRQATTAARNITSEPDRDRALRALALQWAGQQLSEAEALIEEISDESNLSWLIAGLVPLLPAARLPELLSRAAQLKKSESQATAFSALAPHLLPADQGTLLLAVQKMRSQRLKVLTLIAAVPHLQEPHRGETLAKSLHFTKSIKNPVTRAEVAAALHPLLQANQQDETLSDLIRDIRKLKDSDKRGAAWGEIALFLPQSEREQAFTDVLAVKNKRIRAEALEKFAPTLTQERDKRAAVNKAREIDVREYHVKTMAAILPSLSGRLRHTARSSAWKAAREIKNPDKRGLAFRLLAPYMTDAMWRETAQILKRSRSAEGRAFIIQGIANDLPDDMLEMALEVVERIPPGPDRAAALTALAPRLSVENLLPQAMATAREIADTDAQLDALVALAPDLATAGDQVEALNIVGKIREEQSRALAIAELIPRLSRLERRMARERVVAAVHRINEPAIQAWCIEQLASKFPREMLPAAHAIEFANHRAHALLTLIPHLPQDLSQSARQEALVAVQTIMAGLEQLKMEIHQLKKRNIEMGLWTEEEEPLEVWEPFSDTMYSESFLDFVEFHQLDWRKINYLAELETLIPLLASVGFVAEAKEVIKLIEADKPADTWWDYARLVPFLTEPERTETIQNHLLNREFLDNISSELSYDHEKIISLAEYTPETLVSYREVILNVIQEKERALLESLYEPYDHYPYSYYGYSEGQFLTLVQARVALASCLPEPQRRQILFQGIESAQNPDYASAQGRLLADLLPYVTEMGYPQNALGAAKTIPTPLYRALALAGISLHLPSELWPDLLQMVPLIDDEQSEAVLLAGLAPHLPQELLEEALNAARQIELPSARLQALLPLAVRMSQFSVDAALYSLWRDILHLLSREIRRDFLAYVPVLTPLMIALCESDQIIKDSVHSLKHVGHSWP